MKRKSSRRALCSRIVLALTLAVVPGCAHMYSNPEVRILEVGVHSVGLTSASADLRVEVRNPNRFGVELRGLRYQVELGHSGEGGDWVPVGSGSVEERIKIPGRGFEVVTMTLPFEYASLSPLFRLALTGSGFQYRVVGDLSAWGPLGRVDLPFERRGPLRLE